MLILLQPINSSFHPRHRFSLHLFIMNRCRDDNMILWTDFGVQRVRCARHVWFHYTKYLCTLRHFNELVMAFMHDTRLYADELMATSNFGICSPIVSIICSARRCVGLVYNWRPVMISTRSSSTIILC